MEPLRREFRCFPWRHAPAHLEAWQQGRTGYPIVDAGMRELWSTGWMHSRVRMIVASFLVKDLGLAWQEGARWFWDTLAAPGEMDPPATKRTAGNPVGSQSRTRRTYSQGIVNHSTARSAALQAYAMIKDKA